MMKRVFLLLLIELIKTAFCASDPCNDYYTISDSGYRSSDFNSHETLISLCDNYLPESNLWFRFDLDAGTQLPQKPVPLWYCGTQSPIWLNGTHPDDEQEVIQQVCAVDYVSDCWWSSNVSIRYCNSSDSFYVYKLPKPNGCPLAYCVDAATRKQCIPPLVWRDDQCQCGENVTQTTTVPPITQFPPTTLPPEENSDWSSWGAWSSCSKPCDYGKQSRKRTCLNLPCEGSSSETQLCNEYNCQELEEEKNEGIVMELQSQENTMLKFVEAEPTVNNIIRNSVNSLCSNNASMCCGSPVASFPSNGVVFVKEKDLRTSQGYPKPGSGATVIDKVIAVVNEDIDKTICQSTRGASRRIIRSEMKQAANYISYDVMALAVESSRSEIEQTTGITVVSYGHPTTMQQSEPCPVNTCVIPIVIGLLGGVAVILIIIFVIVCKSKDKNRVDSPPPYSPSPPRNFEKEAPTYDNPETPQYYACYSGPVPAPVCQVVKM